MTAAPWWAAVAPAEGEIPCGGTSHRLRWEGGRLLLLDHDDAAAEQALAALGGEPPACVAIRDLWRRCGADVAFVTLGRRPGEASLGFAPPAAGAAAPSAETRRGALVRLLALPLPLLDRLVLTAMAAAASSWADADFRTAHGLRLGAALAARAAPAFRRFGDRLGSGADVIVQCAPTAPDQPPAVRAVRRADGVHLAASLPLSWLASVWGAGISEVGDDVVLAVVGADAVTVELEVLQWESVGPDAWAAVTRRRNIDRS